MTSRPIGWVAFAGALALLAGPARGAPERRVDVGVVPLRGSAPDEDRERASRVILDALSGMPGLRVLSLAKLGELLGPDEAARLEACADDRCLVEVASRVRLDRLVAGQLDADGPRLELRVRLLDTATAAAGRTLVRVTRQVGPGEGGLVQAATSVAAELFPKEALAGFGTLLLRGGIAGAEVRVDGVLQGQLEQAPTTGEPGAVLTVPPGVRQVTVTAPGHVPFDTTTEVLVGQRARVDVRLSKNRSAGPLLLGGAGVLAVGAAAALGVVAQARVEDWQEACPPGMPCSPGFTRARFEDDRAAVDRARIGSNVLWGAAGAALVGALVWYLFDPGRDPEPPPSLLPVVGPGEGGDR